ncbi:bifunctional adenosylcobinamide kinase/adenosylcobinamide-phosphate guanylyltransferase [Marinovum sp. 2_MG-2023]|uniref:bifunctional adenosylcobinamide kinase/adenosylcobinamide-phosphate guanylyltransferase n=1 Tax=unclassified Marinovum TaxID=2647166 RepID=UPI0026E3F8D0|nr:MULTISPECIES: bifunctional adenosylcobinamide kinase/adenosylcobinamide-phosphate guanylyltransferase [unclassified Marinovum]MDO6732088.1 bifunctional adenosylcobinamide kinase/adenosylcobinamide-phosphate guanylyltransferase [Marinovum sp. 2_MG-2023]MDO6781403.1 bifunctional adenosylcobinamide kinase/adenosylcobinamide-phosphate guanylyltransferase [Marinovum sp. 1_MG-2023]
MARIVLITGGARSGKSVLAEKRVLETASKAHYIATAQAFDAEMTARIATHRDRRGPEWHTHEAPLDLLAALRDTDDAPRLVDCLTLWLSNLILAEMDWESRARDMLAALPDLHHPVVFVSNELGMGIVPDNPLARRFRDAAGTLNQWVATQADEVILSVSGLPLKVK